MSFFLQNCQHSTLFLIINHGGNKNHRWNFRSLIAWRVNGGDYNRLTSNISTFYLRLTTCSMMLGEFLSNFQHLRSSDDNIMKELSHFFVRWSSTPIIESFLSSDLRYSTMGKTIVILEDLDALTGLTELTLI